MSGIETIAAYASLGTSLVSAVGAISGGQAQSQMANYNAAVAENAAIANRQAAAAQETQQRRRNQLLLSSQQAAIGASGATQEGSPLLAMADAAAQGELDAQTIRWQGEVAAKRNENQAQLDRMQGDAAVRAGYFGAAASLLNGASRLGKVAGFGTAAKSSSLGDGSGP